MLDRDYPALDELAHATRAEGTEPGAHNAVAAPPLFDAAPRDAGFGAPEPAGVAGRDVWLLHPWPLADPPAGMLVVAAVDSELHARWPWSPLRWA